MAKKNSENVYGIGCITHKQTSTGKYANTYVYAEWHADGRHHSKSCGNVKDPASRKRAQEVLLETAMRRVENLNVAITRLQKDIAKNENVKSVIHTADAM